jgi:hypothetical protein
LYNRFGKLFNNSLRKRNNLRIKQLIIKLKYKPYLDFKTNLYLILDILLFV